MSQGATTPFKGSAFFIESGSGEAKRSTDIRQTNPAVVTIASHGYRTGEVVTITGMAQAGMMELIDGGYPVQALSDDTFALIGIDASAYHAYTKGATAAAKQWLNVCELKTINKQGGSIDQIDVTTICSAKKEYEPGLADEGTLQLDFNYAPAAAAQRQLADYERHSATFWMKLTLPRRQGLLLFNGSLQQGSSFQGGVGQVYTSNVTIKLSGEVVHILPTTT
ncbi:conserved hypothetical protein [Candidatus Glomeribacter gigasporarum BEG34]|uniref:Phage protein n=1 Tax=Candidatus Glomeribacter gigasporarum BEG34 TaxID=1070319 RepID=G2JAU2_9BURK|nr:phage tail tube protein [Candidatus Glomeribacter gigasporarum]CCD29894.1 conserved hypothetical protein [Candidatus Glomeribacter gigasporarum BEG34]